MNKHIFAYLKLNKEKRNTRGGKKCEEIWTR